MCTPHAFANRVAGVVRRSGSTCSVALVVAASLTSAACLPVERLNSDCRWTGDSPGPLDVSRSDDENHLRRDVLIAEELGVRHADATVRPPRVAVREACIARLAVEIGQSHELSPSVVLAQRGRRNWRADAAFLLACALVYGVAAIRLRDWIWERFNASRLSRLLALIGAAVPIAVLAVGVGEVVSMVAEGARVANLGHMSGFRGARIPWKHHRAGLMAGAVVLFWVVALMRVTRSRWAGSGADSIGPAPVPPDS